jgi:hypothetical protein
MKRGSSDVWWDSHGFAHRDNNRAAACFYFSANTRECLSSDIEQRMSNYQLAVGCRVRIQGLVGAPQHNGKEGLLVRFIEDTQRWC